MAELGRWYAGRHPRRVDASELGPAGECDRHRYVSRPAALFEIPINLAVSVAQQGPNNRISTLSLDGDQSLFTQ